MIYKRLRKRHIIWIFLGSGFAWLILTLTMGLLRNLSMNSARHEYQAELIASIGETVYKIDWHPDNTYMAIATDRDVLIYSFNDQSLSPISPDMQFASPVIQWSPDGRSLGISERGLWIWDIEYEAFHSLELPEDRLMDNIYSNLVWSPDSRLFASVFWPLVFGESSEVVICDREESSCAVHASELASNDYLMDWSPDNKYLAIRDAINPRLKIIDFDSEQEIQELSPVKSHAIWSPSGDYLIAQGRGSSVLVWDTQTWRTIHSFREFTADIYSIKWHPTGPYVAIATKNGLRIWNVETQGYYLVQRGEVRAVDWNSDGTYLISALEVSMPQSESLLYQWHIADLP